MILFIYYTLKDTFNTDLLSGDIPDEAVVLIEDTQELYSHKHYFGKDEYCIFDYDAIFSQSGEKYIGNVNATQKYIKFTESSDDVLVPVISQNNNTIRQTINYVGCYLYSSEENNLSGVIINITYSRLTQDLYEATKLQFSINGVTDLYKQVLDTISGGYSTYILGGENTLVTDSTFTAKSKSFSDGSNIPEDDLTIFAATTTQAGVMTAQDKIDLNSTVDSLTWKTIK